MRKRKENDRFVCTYAQRKRDRHVCARKNKIKRLLAGRGKWWDLFIPEMKIAAAVGSYARLESGERLRFSHVGMHL
jgi:hypothetical protein